MFNTINYLLFQKRKELDSELLEEFTPYMVARYMSFYDKNLLTYVNDTINRYGDVFSIKEDQFRFYENMIPILKRKKINYVSRKKKEKVEETQIIPEFYSKREISMLTS